MTVGVIRPCTEATYLFARFPHPSLISHLQGVCLSNRKEGIYRTLTQHVCAVQALYVDKCLFLKCRISVNTRHVRDSSGHDPHNGCESNTRDKYACGCVAGLRE